MDLIKFEGFFTPKETINIMKRQLTEWEKALQTISPCFKVSILLLSSKLWCFDIGPLSRLLYHSKGFYSTLKLT